MTTAEATDIPATSQQRKSSSVRRAELLRAAAELIVDTRSLPLSMQEVGERVGASRALVYAHFTDQSALVDAVLVEHLKLLDDSGLAAAVQSGDVIERATNSAAIYLRHVVDHGAVVHIILRDAPHGAALGPQSTRPRNRALRALAGVARRELALSSEEAIVLVELLIAIPEELGRLCRAQELQPADAEAISSRLIRAAIEGLRPH